MNRSEAQEILLRHRPGQSPADDETRHALALLETDPVLANWYREQHEFHSSFRSALHAVSPPRDLADQILARRKIVAPRWRHRTFLLAAAAAIALLVSGLIWHYLPRESATFAVFQSRMVSFAVRQYRMDIETPDESAVRTYLRENGSPAQFGLPAPLASLPVKGGAALTWKGRPVSMMCFDWQGKETLYLFIIEQNKVAQAALPPDPQPSPYKTVGTAAWQSGNLVYLLVSETGEQTLQALL